MQSHRMHHEQRMRQMIRHLDVDLLELAYSDLGRVYADAQQACFNCRRTGECSRWLAARPAERPTFCTNLQTFERYAAHRLDGSRSDHTNNRRDALRSQTSLRVRPTLRIDANGRWAITAAAALWSSALIALAWGSAALS